MIIHHIPESIKTGVVGIRSVYLCQGRKQPNKISLPQTKVLACFRAPGLGVEPVYCSQEAPIYIPTLKRPFFGIRDLHTRHSFQFLGGYSTDSD